MTTVARVHRALAVVQAGDALACAIPLAPIARALDELNVPNDARWVMVAAKAASVPGLLAVDRFPRLARLTTAMLTVYFTLAVGAHLRVRDRPANTLPAAGLLATFLVLTVTNRGVSPE
ncbi:DoxX family protein [Mycobacterium sp. IDR2000157661]|uniref:DoxX family protein n=1 Tax=Mycobacterium sp. IDR2000157661 TaxID=2867005 RepID=UPI001EEAAE3E|nr:DoxX family protein [Mycobacterium sp. IDR2000157661]ULE32693.1 DoxX family protein [Mycobacterium sp. IDR2000157661]